jgi:hypothetical protein
MTRRCFAIIDCLKKFEPHLTSVKFDILTDHAPLTHWQTQKELSPHQIRWNEALTWVDAMIQHIPRISNFAADALSHYLYVQPKEEEEGAEPADSVSMARISLVKLDPDVLQSICSSYPRDSLFASVTKNPKTYPLYQLTDGLLFFEN